MEQDPETTRNMKLNQALIPGSGTEVQTISWSDTTGNQVYPDVTGESGRIQEESESRNDFH